MRGPSQLSVLRDDIGQFGPMLGSVDDDELYTRMLSQARQENDTLAQPLQIDVVVAQVQDAFNSLKSGRSDRVRPRVITLCGSTRFKEEFFVEQERLTLAGYIVISVGLFGWDKGRPEDALGEHVKEMLDQLHFRKIDISDGIHVVNKDGYVGSSTANEIAYAARLGKAITYMEDAEDDDE